MSKRIVITALFLALLLAGCGGEEQLDVFPEESEGEVMQQELPAEPTPEPQQPSTPSLVCEDPAPVELGIGESHEDVIDDPVWTRCYWVQIPEGLTSLSFELGGLNADLNMSVGYGFLVTLQYNIGEFWQVAQDGTADEILTLENPAPGPYFIKVGIAGLKEPSPFTLEVRTVPESTSGPSGAALPEPGECAPPAIEIPLDGSIDSEIVGKSQDPLPRRYFCVQVPQGLSNLTVQISGLEGNLDLFVRRTQPAEWMDLSRGGDSRTVLIENPVAGAYYVTVAGALTGAGSPFTLNVSSP